MNDDLLEFCAFCDKEATHATCYEERWWPDFYWGDYEISNHVCPDCMHNIERNADGEFVAIVPRTRPIHIYEFDRPIGDESSFAFTKVSQAHLDYILKHRPGATMTHRIVQP